MNTPSMIRVGTAGWSIPKEVAAAFPTEGSHLERYAQVFPGVEINSSFYRPHRVATYERWAASVPDGFRFAVKVPKALTHDSRLSGTEDLLNRFLVEVGGLGRKLGPLLVQLPPSLSFAAGTADRFLRDLRARVEGPIACEPRHRSWFTPDVDALLEELRIGRVAADPAPVPGASSPGGWRGLTYYRLHGSPRIYHSAYGSEAIRDVVDQLHRRAREGSDGWCIFDNTAVFAATPNALAAQEAVVVLTTKSHVRSA
ncbi:DUF72 domain-containing protein [Rubellimicrobium roseum]|uniref:DUF72 domain-containing protein n=1 Tax=Rubellimicrobium roseum TaxID=687525 RepID=A0A5C4N553_9RHOB|nr:DUF72 domain-containing protein [Rubellimicrobium roseum]TNC63993.1 DUF72 domain-containing protein [Rubellimicrobium roseum]